MGTWGEEGRGLPGRGRRMREGGGMGVNRTYPVHVGILGEHVNKSVFPFPPNYTVLPAMSNICFQKVFKSYLYTSEKGLSNKEFLVRDSLECESTVTQTFTLEENISEERGTQNPMG